ncbi:MAG TPA: helix-turn-helix domain-containing protein [Phycisphaerae bacterium]|nr:helix-turn-helix domain-containing protein [Phycisphaerae bacterium]
MIAAVIEQQAPKVAQLLLKPAEAAKALGIGSRTLWGLTKAGEIACVRVGRSVRYATADLQAWVEKKRVGN